jgi:Fe-S cluster assembly scaffold protein SufB
MLKLDDDQKTLLAELTDAADIEGGAFNVRVNGASAGRQSTESVRIEPKPGNSGFDIYIAPGARAEKVHIPVVITASGLRETVYNDFRTGEGADVSIVAGCGIHNCGGLDSRHDGVHRFWLGRGAKASYTEKHVGTGDGKGRRLLNPVTEVHQDEDSSMEMEMVQIKGVDSTERTTLAELKKGASLVVRERLMTHGEQKALSVYKVTLYGDGSSADVVSRSVARDDSYQKFEAVIVGSAACSGHTECDAIIMDNGRILAVPRLEANSVDAALVHEAAIGKIAGEQLTKLMTLGLSEEEAEEQIINGFLK